MPSNSLLMKSFHQKVIVITGAGSGIGRALAQAFAAKGAKLALNDFNAASLAETVAELESTDEVFSQAFDVADRAQMFAFAEAVLAQFGQVDVMINNAGRALGNYDFDQIDLDHFEHIMGVNFNGVLYGSRAFIPHLLQRPEASLVNISSVFGLSGIVQGSAYCASKFAVNGLNQTLIQEYRDTKLRVHSVHPGGIKTNITRNSIDYEPRFELFDVHLRHSPAYAAKTIIRGIERRKKRILIGPEAYLIDWTVRLFPVLGNTLINKYLERTRRKIEASAK